MRKRCTIVAANRRCALTSSRNALIRRLPDQGWDVVLVTGMAFVEMLGVASVMAFLSQPDVIQTNIVLKRTYTTFPPPSS